MGWAFLLVGTLGAFGMYGAKVVAGSPSDAFKPSVWSKIEGSHTATELLWRMLLVVALGGLLLAFGRRALAAWRAAAAAICLGIVLTFSSIGHANTQHPTALWVGVDALHLTSLSVWIGGLLMLAFGTSTWLTDSGSERIVRRFSVTSMVAVPIIVATGVAQTLKLAGSLSDLTGTSWGRTLLVKVSVVTVLVAIGGVSQWLLRHDGPSALKRNVLVEALIGIGVIGLAAALVALPPQVAAASKVFTATLTNQGVVADVTVTPGRVGQNEVHLVITPPGGSLAPVMSTSVQAVPPAGGTGVVPATLAGHRREPLHRHDHVLREGRLDPHDHRRPDGRPVGGADLDGADSGIAARSLRGGGLDDAAELRRHRSLRSAGGSGRLACRGCSGR